MDIIEILTWIGTGLCVLQSGFFSGRNLAIFGVSALMLPQFNVVTEFQGDTVIDQDVILLWTNDSSQSETSKRLAHRNRSKHLSGTTQWSSRNSFANQ